MTSLAFLAGRSLGRHPVRTLLVILGLSVTGALLLDMTMLSHGLEASLGTVLSRLGFAVRVVPKGTLPFSSPAEISDGDRLAAAIAGRPGVAGVVPVLATNLYVHRGGDRFPAFAVGVPAGGSGFYALLEGHDVREAAAGSAPGSGAPAHAKSVPPVVIDRNMAHLEGVGVGDTLVLSAAPQPYITPYAAPRAFRVVGIADFYFDLPNQQSVALLTGDLRQLEGRTDGAVSLILVRMAEPAGAESLARWITARDPRVDALSIQGFLRRASTQLTYFTQFSLILGTISIVVSFLLITAIVTLSLGERLGEIAMLRALGFTRGRIGALILLEGVLLSAASLPGTFGLGLLISQNLDTILRAAPSVPEGLHFFTLTAQAGVRTVALLLVTGALGGLYPAATASRLGVAATLHGEVAS
jgi:putative ABC transport system permease protein